jgi:hypothetical protein
VKRAKWADTPGTAATIALVKGSSAVLEDGVSTPISFRLVIAVSGVLVLNRELLAVVN